MSGGAGRSRKPTAGAGPAFTTAGRALVSVVVVALAVSAVACTSEPEIDWSTTDPTQEPAEAITCKPRAEPRAAKPLELVVATDGFSDSLVLMWSGGPGDANGWQYRLRGSHWTDMAGIGLHHTSYRLRGLQPGVHIEVQLRAVLWRDPQSAAGYGPPTGWVRGAPQRPDRRYEEIGHDQVVVAGYWTDWELRGSGLGVVFPLGIGSHIRGRAFPPASEEVRARALAPGVRVVTGAGEIVDMASGSVLRLETGFVVRQTEAGELWADPFYGQEVERDVWCRPGDSPEWEVHAFFDGILRSMRYVGDEVELISIPPAAEPTARPQEPAE